MILIYLLIVGAGCGLFLSLLAKELNWKSPFSYLPFFGGPTLIKDVSQKTIAPVEINEIIEPPIKIEIQPAGSNAHEKIIKLEMLLSEKNREISRLNFDLQSRQNHDKEFDKVKNILEEEIQRLREKNRGLSAELSSVQVSEIFSVPN